MANEDDRQGYPDEVIQRMYAEQGTPMESFNRQRKPITGYPFINFGEDVNAKVRGLLFNRVKTADLRRAGKRKDSDTE